ncbi:NAD(P)/FAD-dependent oxidoreductase [Sinorhizobium numidicum]|uniref:NAD(P)/FAD-dependent oxidoreductase n=1 Tax=Sinorhizobium numidicum TaxID=680248 RepID=A0ABY8CR78_9HYPH|nr:NAD(P)/FAD-dependent oxidoreductase [Sinorhizobium numidicum]WEX75161.1 NAD(P)/FAD-dependent oxidoreductase [Sinorhizobium numidicum]WEX81154.1 NAD(P)/FAD-dependent oxidoreductase [Sinorhizobium numidicum]
MTDWTRRQIGGLVGGALLGVAAPHIARGQGRPRVIVIGGGIGGATVARYLADLKSIDVTLVEPNSTHVTCFFSNLYLAGLRSLASLTFGLETLAERHGITIIRDSAVAIDPAGKGVELQGGPKLSYDRLVVAPGIAFKFGEIGGYDEAAAKIMPHAWIAGPQSELLRRQLKSMDDGGVFVIAAPPNPFRCPPAPYERASLVAYYFKQFKPKSKILILDAKDTFSGQELFQDAWSRHYPGMIEWLPSQFTGAIKAVDVAARSVVTEGETFRAAVANIIPAQKAGLIGEKAGLTDASGWCPVDPVTFESTLQPGIHVVGDSIIGGDMPKSAFSANSQAKACAFAVAASLTGSPHFPPHLFNSCYTFLAPDDAFTNALTFASEGGKIKTVKMFISKVGESAEARRRTAHHAVGWYSAFTADVFGGGS